MADGAVIPSDRTAVPVEWDEVKTQLMRLATELGPKTGRVGHLRCPGSSTAPPTRWTATATSYGRRWLNCPASARIFAEGSGNIVDIIKNLQIFVTALRDSKEQIVMFQNRLASLTSVVDDSRSDLDAALSDLSVAIGEVQRFVAGSREPDLRADPQSRQRHPDPGRQPHGSRERSAHRAERVRQLRQHLLPGRRCGDRSVLARQLRESGVVRLRHDRRRREHHRARDGEAVRAVSRSGAAAAQLQLPAVADQPVPAAPPRPGKHHLHRPEAGTRRRRTGRCA